MEKREGGREGRVGMQIPKLMRPARFEADGTQRDYPETSKRDTQETIEKHQKETHKAIEKHQKRP